MKCKNPQFVSNAIVDGVDVLLDRDVFLCVYVHTRQGGTSQSMGGYVVGGVRGAKAGRHGESPNIAAENIVGVLEACGATSIKECNGKAVRIERSGARGLIVGIGHIIDDDKWFYPEEAFQKLLKEFENRGK